MSNGVIKSKPYVRESSAFDCGKLAKVMREEDQQELWFASRSTPLQSLFNGYKGNRCWTGVNHTTEEVFMMFGVSRKDEFTGVPWMLASDDLKNVRRTFIKECGSYLEQMFEGYDVLTNHVWSKNEVHIKWLKWLGFKFLQAEPMGIDGELFYEFYKLR
jgi:hypothetical protein